MKKILTLLLSVLFLSSFPTFATAKGITFTVLCDNNPYNLIMKNCRQDVFFLSCRSSREDNIRRLFGKEYGDDFVLTGVGKRIEI